jgi:hypothetical protein
LVSLYILPLQKKKKTFLFILFGIRVYLDSGSCIWYVGKDNKVWRSCHLFPFFLCYIQIK